MHMVVSGSPFVCHALLADPFDLWPLPVRGLCLCVCYPGAYMENLAGVVDRHLISCATGTVVFCNLYPCNFIQASGYPWHHLGYPGFLEGAPEVSCLWGRGNNAIITCNLIKSCHTTAQTQTKSSTMPEVQKQKTMVGKLHYCETGFLYRWNRMLVSVVKRR